MTDAIEAGNQEIAKWSVAQGNGSRKSEEFGDETSQGQGLKLKL
jgi:hypothetical protein